MYSIHNTRAKSYTITFPAFMYFIRQFASFPFFAQGFFSSFCSRFSEYIDAEVNNHPIIKKSWVSRNYIWVCIKGFAQAKIESKRECEMNEKRLLNSVKIRDEGEKPFLLISVHFFFWKSISQWLAKSQRQDEKKNTTWFWWINSKQKHEVM